MNERFTNSRNESTFRESFRCGSRSGNPTKNGGITQEEPYTLGDGYGHLAVSVDNVEEAHARYKDQGVTVGDIVEFAPGGEIVAKFCFVTDPDGYKIEVIERGGRFK